MNNQLGLPVAAITLTDRSGTITTGGTAQTAAVANTARKYLIIQNTGAEDLWFNFGVAAVEDQPSLLLAPGASFEAQLQLCPQSLVSVIGATTGNAFTIKEG